MRFELLRGNGAVEKVLEVRRATIGTGFMGNGQMDKKIKMLTYILQEHRKIIYDYGLKVLCEINLDGLEIKYNLSNYDMTPAQRKTRHKHRSAIDWLCRCGAESAVTMPDIRRVIEGKWKRWGLNLLMTKCILSCVTNVAVMSLSVLLSVDPTPTPSTVAEALTTIFYLILWILFSLLFLEAAMLAYNQVQWDHMRGVPRFHLVCKIVKIFSFAIFCYFGVNQSHLDEDGSMHFNYPVEVKASLALCIIACWLHLYYYLMGRLSLSVGSRSPECRSEDSWISGWVVCLVLQWVVAYSTGGW